MDHYTPSPRALRAPATLVFGGVLLSLVVGLFHVGPSVYALTRIFPV